MKKAVNMTEYIQRKNEFMEALIWGAFHMADDGSKSYHYTSLDGFKNILDSNKIYATEYHYLNDEEEFRYIDNLVDEMIEKLFSNTTNEEVLIGLLRKHLDELRLKTDKPEESYYVVCFSNKKDNLTLWSEFASYGCNFEANPYTMFESAIKFHSVIYDYASQQALIKDSFQNVFDHFGLGVDISHKASIRGKLEKLNTIQLDIVAECIAELLVYYGTLMKRELYAAEQEFRVILSGKGKEIKYRVKEHMLIPYIEVSLSRERWLGNEIILAPLNHKDSCKRSVQTYIDSLGYKDVKVAYSEIRLRY